jgi:hypothetical protein
MKHAREDYNRIQDPENKIAEDEPVFLLRAQDKFSPEVVRHWANLVKESGDSDLANHVLHWADKMRAWQLDNGYKIPDSPEVGLGKQ